MNKASWQTLGLILIALLLTACAVGSSLKIGDAFTVNSYQVKLVQVETRPAIIAATSDRICSTDPQQNDSTWLVLTVEVANKGSSVSPLSLSASDTAVVDASGKHAPLSGVGVSIEEGAGFVLAFVDEKKLAQGWLASGAKGHVFVIPEGSKKLIIAGKPGTVIGNPEGPQWDLGKLSPDGTIQVSLLFEIPKDTTELTWQFLGSPPAKLPGHQTESAPEERGPTFTISMTDNELCQLAEPLELECP